MNLNLQGTDNRKKLSFDYLYERGFLPTVLVGGANRIYNKWGFELEIHLNFIFCLAKLKTKDEYIEYEYELLELEKQLNIDKTDNICKMSIEQLKGLIPGGYDYKLDKRRKHIESKENVSYSTKKGRYKIFKGDELISEGYNDEEEDYFLGHSLLFILKKENLLLRNS